MISSFTFQCKDTNCGLLDFFTSTITDVQVGAVAQRPPADGFGFDGDDPMSLLP
jgi:hypothetical protein